MVPAPYMVSVYGLASDTLRLLDGIERLAAEGRRQLPIHPATGHQLLAQYHETVKRARETLAQYDARRSGLDLEALAERALRDAHALRSLGDTIGPSDKPVPFLLEDHWSHERIYDLAKLLDLFSTHELSWNETKEGVTGQRAIMYEPMTLLHQCEVARDALGAYVTPTGLYRRLQVDNLREGTKAGFFAGAVGGTGLLFFDASPIIAGAALALGPIIGAVAGAYRSVRPVRYYAFDDVANILEQRVPELLAVDRRIAQRRTVAENAPVL